MLATALRLLQIALTAACIYLVYGTVSPLLGATRPPTSALPEVDVPASTAPELAALQVIESRNLFRAGETDAAPAPVTEDIAESKLRVKLLGTIAVTRANDEPGDPSVASFRDNKGEHVAVRVGDTLAGARVERIEARRVVVLNRGVREQISLLEDDEGTRATRAATSPKRRVARRVRPRARASRPRPAGDLEKMAEQIASPQAPEPGAASPTEPPAADSADNDENDETDESFQAETVRALYPGAELQEGERVVAINGVQLSSDNEFAAAIGDPGAKTLEIEAPDGSKRTVQVPQ